MYTVSRIASRKLARPMKGSDDSVEITLGTDERMRSWTIALTIEADST
jgi:hypothetical protein